MKSLDVEAVQAFLLVAKFKSFTRAAEILGATQAAVSLKIKRLEDSLGHRLLERTPRRVRLSEDGRRFSAAAAGFLHAHDAAFGVFKAKRRRLSVGITHHIVGPQLPVLLREVVESDPELSLELHVSTSQEVMAKYDNGTLDVAVVLCHDNTRRGGKIIFREPFAWFASHDFTHAPSDPIRLASQAAPCSIRNTALRTLDDAGIEWFEAFTGGGVAAVSAAVAGGLAVAALSRNASPPGTTDVTLAFGLPSLDTIDVAMFSGTATSLPAEAVLRLSSALQASRRED